MNQKEAWEILIKLLDKGILDEKEREAVFAAVGVLSWTSLAESRIKSLRKKREERGGSLHKRKN